jgi:hypothetical protein
VATKASVPVDRVRIRVMRRASLFMIEMLGAATSFPNEKTLIVMVWRGVVVEKPIILYNWFDETRNSSTQNASE